MAEQNEFRIENLGSACVLNIKGDLTAASEPLFISAYTEANTNDPKHLLFNFEEKAYINSSGIAVFIQLLVKAKQNDKIIGVTGISDHFKKIFHMVGITKFAKIYTSVDEFLKETGG